MLVMASIRSFNKWSSLHFEPVIAMVDEASTAFFRVLIFSWMARAVGWNSSSAAMDQQEVTLSLIEGHTVTLGPLQGELCKVAFEFGDGKKQEL
jgi:hypothetical protein